MRLVDADALIDIFEDRLEKTRNRYGDYSGEAGVCACALHLIREQPTIEEHKTGKWVPFEFGDETWHKCTACGVADNYISIVQRPNGTTGRLKSVRNFCPSCGADMREQP